MRATLLFIIGIYEYNFDSITQIQEYNDRENYKMHMK